MTEKKRKAVYNPEADKKWREKNRAHVNYMNQRRTARSFIRNHATSEDLDELDALILEKREKLARQNCENEQENTQVDQ